jgi:small subunit ribosomal protein S24e
MEIKITLKKENPLLKRKEIAFQVQQTPQGGTPPRLEVKKAVADALATNADVVFVTKFETRTGMNTAVGTANVYDSVEQAKLVEPEHIIKRNSPPAEKPKEEEKKE